MAVNDFADARAATAKRIKLKKAIKFFFYGIAAVLVSPFALAELCARAVLHRDVWFASQTELFSVFPGKTGYFLRNAYYRLTLRRCPWNCCFLIGTMFTHSGAEVGEHVYIGAHSIIGLARIGDDTMLADHVYVLSGKNQHGTARAGLSFQAQAQSFTRVNIGRNSWLGTNSVIMADVGDDCVIGAGSVVTRPVPDRCVAAGNPARVIRSTSPEGSSERMQDQAFTEQA